MRTVEGGLEGEKRRASDSELVFPLQLLGSKGPPLKTNIYSYITDFTFDISAFFLYYINEQF